MLNTTERIAVMGGTFNPIHYAHLLSAEQVRTGLGYDKILFIPSARPPHKVSDVDIITPEHRYQMVLLAIAENPHFEVSRIELDRAGPSYTIETLKALEKRYGNTRELGWIIGADSLIEYKIWKNFDEVFTMRYDRNDTSKLRSKSSAARSAQSGYNLSGNRC